MQSTTNLRVTNFIAMILMLTGIGGLQAWLLPTHCLHSLENWPLLHRAFRQCVEHVQAMVIALPGRLPAWLVPTDCLRSLENRPPFQRAFRQSVGNAEAICSLYDNACQQPDDNCSFDFGSSYAKAPEIQSRLLAILKRARCGDMVSKRGEPTVTNVDQSQLKGFNFNAGVSLMSSFIVRCPIVIDRATGQAIITIPTFIARTMVKGATYPSTTPQLPLRVSPGQACTGRQICLAWDRAPNGPACLDHYRLRWLLLSA